MAVSVLRERSKEFAIRIVTVCRTAKKGGGEAILLNQLLRSGTSVGANVHEAQYAQSPKDFISKLEIALKECNESDYWVELLYAVDTISVSDYQELKNTLIELRRMLVASVRTMKEKERE